MLQKPIGIQQRCGIKRVSISLVEWENLLNISKRFMWWFFFFLYYFMLPFNLKRLLVLSRQVIFITEYMSSGSLKQFLKKTKKNHKTMNEKV